GMALPSRPPVQAGMPAWGACRAHQDSPGRARPPGDMQVCHDGVALGGTMHGIMLPCAGPVPGLPLAEAAALPAWSPAVRWGCCLAYPAAFSLPRRVARPGPRCG